MLVLSPSVEIDGRVGLGDAAPRPARRCPGRGRRRSRARPVVRQPLEGLGVLVDDRSPSWPSSAILCGDPRPDPAAADDRAASWRRSVPVGGRRCDASPSALPYRPCHVPARIDHRRPARLRHRRLGRAPAAVRERAGDRAGHRPALSASVAALVRDPAPPGAARRRPADHRLRRCSATIPPSSVVAEVMGGVEPDPRATCSSCSRAGKSVVSANKQLLARHGEELFTDGRAARRPAALRGQRLRRHPRDQGAARVDDRRPTSTASTASSTAPPTSS